MATTAGDIADAPAIGGVLDETFGGVRLHIDIAGESCYIEAPYDAESASFAAAVDRASAAGLELIPEDDCDVEDTGTAEIYWLGTREETA